MRRIQIMLAGLAIAALAACGTDAETEENLAEKAAELDATATGATDETQ
ncbi:MAG TPA: hypothetical protein VGD10_04135 [Allosphingosinicella sp.]